MRRPRSAAAPSVARHTAFYARVTTEESVRADLSLPNQRRRFDELAAERGWQGQAYVEDGAVSGELGPEHRPALAALLRAVHAGVIGRVVVRHLDRLGRGKVLEEIVALLRAHGIELWTFDGQQDVRSAAGRLGIRAQAMVGAFEVERTGERVREMKRQKARQGHYVGPTPYGYTSQARRIRELTAAYGPEREAEARHDAEAEIPHGGRLLIDPHEAVVVREIFRLYLDERLGCRRIANALTEAGHRTRDGFPWSSQSVQRVVRDPKVAGYVTFDEDAYQVGAESRLPVWEQERYEAEHEAIVPIETWEAAQDVRRAAREGMKTSAGPARVYALRGVVRCAHGHPAKARRASGIRDQAYYTCRTRCIRGPDPALGGCDARPMEVGAAEAAVREVLASLLEDPRQLHAYLDAARRSVKTASPPVSEQARVIEDELRALEAARSRYYRLLEATEAGSEAESAALERVVELKREIAAKREERAALASPVVPLPKAVTLEQVRAFVGGLRARLSDDPAELQALVAALAADHGLEVHLLDDGRVRVSLAVDPEAIDGGPRLVATARPRVPVTMEGGDAHLDAAAWLTRAQENAPACACGCGERIVVKPEHRWKGLPRHIQGHHRMNMAAFVDAIHAEGLLTVSEAARELGIGETTLRRAEERGLVAPVRRAWGARAPMRLYPRAALPGVRAALHAAGVAHDRTRVLRANEVAAELGVAPRILRRWERDGMVPEPERDAKGTRVYPVDAAERLRSHLVEREAADLAALHAEGLVTRDEARRMLGVSRREFQRRVTEGRLAPVERAVLMRCGRGWGVQGVQCFSRGAMHGPGGPWSLIPLRP